MYDTLHNLAIKTNSTLISIEHRFFGTSKPAVSYFSIQYLSIQNILEDLSLVLQDIKNNNPNIKRIFVAGCGYAGSLAAWFRIKYPDIADGSWSSSSGIKSQFRFPEYDQQLANRIDSIDHKCLVQSHDLITQIDNELFVQHNYELYNIFGIPEIETIESVAYTLSEGFSLLERSGILQDYCQNLTKFPNLTTYAIAFNRSMSILNYKLSMYDLDDLLEDEKPRIYIQCKNIGWFHVYSNTSSYILRSKYINETFYHGICQDHYGVKQFSDDLNYFLDPKDTHLSQMIFTYREFDPFSLIGINKNNSSPNIKYVQVNNSYHAWDLNPRPEFDTEALVKTRAELISFAENIITDKCSKTCPNDSGFCVEGNCVCKPGFSGENCNTMIMLNKHYKVFSALNTLIPTILFIAIVAMLFFVFPEKSYHMNF
ncbi:serine-type peptidase protein [Trichomonas vaginalis G3]|nr:serine-type peptidase protein [Trichomonas vaginalis G3]KAI5483723.1 serine-type peptidase protein [Trichomonas vaginalis G3]